MNVKKYLYNLLVLIDQGVNTIAAGKPDCTISACAYAHHKDDKFWGMLLPIIDFAFYPLDGSCHCKQAYDNDNENYNKGGVLRKLTIALVSVPFCVVLSVLVTWPWYFLNAFIKYIRKVF